MAARSTDPIHGRWQTCLHANPSTARDFQVVSIPTLILFKDGQPVKRIVGAKGKAALLREIADVV